MHDPIAFLVPAHPGSPGKRAVKRVFVRSSYNARMAGDCRCKTTWTARRRCVRTSRRRSASWSRTCERRRRPSRSWRESRASSRTPERSQSVIVLSKATIVHIASTQGSRYGLLLQTSWRGVVCVSLCLSVRYNSEPRKSGWSDRDAACLLAWVQGTIYWMGARVPQQEGALWETRTRHPQGQSQRIGYFVDVSWSAILLSPDWLVSHLILPMKNPPPAMGLFPIYLEIVFLCSWWTKRNKR